MIENFRYFEAADPFGQTWKVRFLWLQTAISIRHSDSVDVKFALSNGETETAKVIALMHADLLALSATTGRPITDSWCSRLAALHLKQMIETSQDMEKTLVTLTPADLAEHAGVLATSAVS